MKLKIQVKPLEIKPLSLAQTGGLSREILPDAGNQPDPTREQLREFKQHSNEWVDDIVSTSLRRHNKTDVLHGSRSLQMLLGSAYPRKPKDWDVYSTQEKRRALQIEASIDKKAGCDIAQTRFQPIPKVSSGPDDPFTGKHLYIVETPRVHNDASIDYMHRPPRLPTQMYKGIRHENLRIAYQKASIRIFRQPLQAHKARKDKQAIENYGRKGINIPGVPSL